MMLRVSVSDLDLYRSWRDDDDFPLEVFLAQLRRKTPPTPAMERGRAFAHAMEHAALGESATISADGHLFAFTCDAEIEAMPRREIKGEKQYGDVVVTARCDRLRGRVIADDKTTSHFDAEGYIEKYQWRFYLDIFDADLFRWHIWECKEMDLPPFPDMSTLRGEMAREAAEAEYMRYLDSHAWCVYAHHLLVQKRYPGMEQDCAELVEDFARFAATIGWTGSVRAA